MVERSRRHPNELIEGLLRERSVNLLVGDSGLGKTPLAIQIGVCVATGLPLFGRRVQQGRVFYCDAESDLPGFWEMLNAISRYLELAEPPLDFHVWSPNWATDLRFNEVGTSWSTELLSRVSVVRPRLVIVDPLRMFLPEAETNSQQAAMMITSLRRLSGSTGTSWLILHHRRKVGQKGSVADLVDNPHFLFQEAAGAHALVNQSDTRIGVIPGSGQADLLAAGFRRGFGAIAPLDLVRDMEDDGTPIGYRLLTGIEHLRPEDRAIFDNLEPRFRFKDVLAAMGGRVRRTPRGWWTSACPWELSRRRARVIRRPQPRRWTDWNEPSDARR